MRYNVRGFPHLWARPSALITSWYGLSVGFLRPDPLKTMGINANTLNMKPSLSLLSIGLLSVFTLQPAWATAQPANAAGQPGGAPNCLSAIAADEKLSKPKLSDAFKINCAQLMNIAAPLQSAARMNDNSSGIRNNEPAGGEGNYEGSAEPINRPSTLPPSSGGSAQVGAFANAADPVNSNSRFNAMVPEPSMPQAQDLAVVQEYQDQQVPSYQAASTDDPMQRFQDSVPEPTMPESLLASEVEASPLNAKDQAKQDAVMAANREQLMAEEAVDQAADVAMIDKRDLEKQKRLSELAALPAEGKLVSAKEGEPGLNNLNAIQTNSKPVEVDKGSLLTEKDRRDAARATIEPVSFSRLNSHQRNRAQALADAAQRAQDPNSRVGRALANRGVSTHPNTLRQAIITSGLETRFGLGAQCTFVANGGRRPDCGWANHYDPNQVAIVNRHFGTDFTSAQIANNVDAQADFAMLHVNWQYDRAHQHLRNAGYTSEQDFTQQTGIPMEKLVYSLNTMGAHRRSLDAYVNRIQNGASGNAGAFLRNWSRNIAFHDQVATDVTGASSGIMMASLGPVRRVGSSPLGFSSFMNNPFANNSMQVGGMLPDGNMGAQLFNPPEIQPQQQPILATANRPQPTVPSIRPVASVENLPVVPASFQSGGTQGTGAASSEGRNAPILRGYDLLRAQDRNGRDI